MNARQSLIVQAMHGTVVLFTVVVVCILGYHGTLDGQSVVAILGAAIGFAGGAVAATGALGQAVNGKSVVSEASMASREQTLRTSIQANAAGAQMRQDAATVQASSGE